MQPKIGLVLSGGGARGAYQAGVLKALFELYPELRTPVITGFSAGAINASFMASKADDPKLGSEDLVNLWSQLRTNQVFDTNILRILANGMRVVWDLGFGGIHRSTSTQSLLNTAPLRKLIESNTDFLRIREMLNTSVLDAVAVGATDYGSAESVTFYHDRFGREPWKRKRRRAVPMPIQSDHVMASSALPLLFPAIKVNESWFGDGSLRNVSPLSAAVHLGSQKLLIVGVRRQKEALELMANRRKPSIGRVLGVILNAILLDTTDTDVERLARINETLKWIPQEHLEKSELRQIDFAWITPSIDLGRMAFDYLKDLPWLVRYLLRGLGTREELSEIASYLLFDRGFCSRLVEIGYNDLKERRAEIDRLLS